MQFDDRLITVLRTGASGEAAARVQFRQLLDLLGSLPQGSSGPLIQAGYERLETLASQLPAAIQSRILRSPDLRLRSRALVAWLATQEPQVAAAAMATARLSEREWLSLIPRFPIVARGFLRHRRDLPIAVRRLLARLGVTDLVLPEPAGALRSQVNPPPSTTPRSQADPDGAIGAIMQRIEDFQRARRDGSPRAAPGPEIARSGIDFASDARGTIVWADPPVAPLLVGLPLASERPGATATLDAESARRLGRHLPVTDGRLTIDGVGAVAGAWRIDAVPAFDPAGARFTGHRGRLRRPAEAVAAEPADSREDQMRQVLHELRTPVNAIQGFAEIIQQQMFGPAPNEYRALAAGIAVDAARLLAGFEDVDRLAQLDSGALTLGEGRSDMRAVVFGQLRRLESVLRPRNARIAATTWGSPFLLGFDESETQRLTWRLLASVAGAVAPGEVIELELSGDGSRIGLRLELPASLRGESDMFATEDAHTARAISAGMFGSGFALRLARAEAAAAGGSLTRQDEMLALDLPALTASAPLHTVESTD